MNSQLTNRLYPHIPALDGLRALAILLVIPHNAGEFVTPVPAPYVPLVLISNFGWIGVQLFFVLSGFLITGNLLDSQRSPNYYPAFFARRILRIFPLYYATLFVAFVVAPLVLPLPKQFSDSMHNQIWLWTFLLNWTQPFGLGVPGFSHFWSLAVEEQFYLAWPFLLKSRSPRQVVKLCTALVIAAIAIRSLMVFNGVRSSEVYEFTFCRMDALALGAIGAALIRTSVGTRIIKSISTRLYIYGLALLFMLSLGTRVLSPDDPSFQVIGYTFLALGFTLFVLAANFSRNGVSGAITRLLSTSPLRAIGRYSYAIYVFHMPLHVFLGEPLLLKLYPTVPPFIATVYLVALTLTCIGLAALSYHFFERYFLRFKRNFVPITAPLPS